ncbi:MAG: hydantoinase/oxoprolinase family protein [Solirubrobacterales bacterium]|nr:hydantoinase/oxoprolinase family protein [Solirubrobacterales bacterium]
MDTALQADAAASPAAPPRPATVRRYTVDIDIGGTLTDGLYSDGRTVTPVKVETTPHDFTVCFFENLKEGARRLGYDDLKNFLAEVAVIRWSATIATNIIAERKGPRIGLLVSAGTGEELYGDGPSAAVGNVISSKNIIALPSDPSEGEMLAAIRDLLAKGVRRIAVSLEGAFEDNATEVAIKNLVDENFPDHYLGAVPLMLGSEICRHPDDQTRTHMALVNSYVHTPLAVALFAAEDRLLGEFGYRRPLYIAHVNGGVARVAKTTAVDTAESSPYFGLNGCAWFARLYGEDKVLALDVGGTTSKLGVVLDGEPIAREHGDLLGVPLKTPWTLMRSEAVGGGSIAKGVDGEVKLGPESQGAFPGPACYDLGGGQATLTDAFVVGGAMNPKRFLGGRRELRVDLAREAIRGAVAEPLGIDVEDAAASIVERGVQIVADAAAEMLAEVGLRPDGFKLFCFGGNGANFAVALADRLGLDQAYAFSLGPVLSAFGSSVAEICHLHEEWPFLDLSTGGVDETVAEILATGLSKVLRDLEGERLPVADARFECDLTVVRDGRPERHELPSDPGAARGVVASLGPAGGIVDRVCVRGLSPVPRFEPTPEPVKEHLAEPAGTRAAAGREVKVLTWESLAPGAQANGPAVLESETNSCAIPAGWSVQIDGFGNALLRRAGQEG